MVGGQGWPAEGSSWEKGKLDSGRGQCQRVQHGWRLAPNLKATVSPYFALPQGDQTHCSPEVCHMPHPLRKEVNGSHCILERRHLSGPPRRGGGDEGRAGRGELAMLKHNTDRLITSVHGNYLHCLDIFLILSCFLVPFFCSLLSPQLVLFLWLVVMVALG